MATPRTPTRVGWAVPADDSTTEPHQKVFGYIALNACTVLWGTQHAVIKGLVISSSLPMLVNAIRFSTAAVVTTFVRALLAGFGCSRVSLDVAEPAAVPESGFRV